MKIGIITFHFASNCGAVLQCLALSETLKKLGHDVYVIDYKPSYHTKRYQALKDPFYYGKKAMMTSAGASKKLKVFRYLKGFAGAVYAWRFYFVQKEINEHFKSFVFKHLNLTKEYSSLKELQAYPPSCDLYISGSDQVWNTVITDGTFDTAYLLDFGLSETRRISYAAGVNIKNCDAVLNKYEDLLNRFQTISLREKRYRGNFERIVSHQERVRIDIDPTLLLECDEYQRYMSKDTLETDTFILIYTMQDSSQKEVDKVAYDLAQKTGWKVIDISNNPKRRMNKAFECRNCGPSEFLWYVKHAEFVITNSYHSTVFSILFETKFIAIPHSQTGYRITELLDELGLSRNYTEETEMAVACYNREANCCLCKQKIQIKKEKSISYLSFM